MVALAQTQRGRGVEAAGAGRRALGAPGGGECQDVMGPGCARAGRSPRGRPGSSDIRNSRRLPVGSGHRGTAGPAGRGPPTGDRSDS